MSFRYFRKKSNNNKKAYLASRRPVLLYILYIDFYFLERFRTLVFLLTIYTFSMRIYIQSMLCHCTTLKVALYILFVCIVGGAAIAQNYTPVASIWMGSCFEDKKYFYSQSTQQQKKYNKGLNAPHTYFRLLCDAIQFDKKMYNIKCIRIYMCTLYIWVKVRIVCR